MLLPAIAVVHKHKGVVLSSADDVKVGEAAEALEQLFLVEEDGGMVIRDDVEVHPSTEGAAGGILRHFVDELGCCKREKEGAQA